jgi:hypothetical protein
MKPTLMRTLFIYPVVLIALQSAIAGLPLVSFRDYEDLSPRKVERLTQSAYMGDAEAALSLARYYWIVKRNMSLTERFFTLAAGGGSKRACDALVAFYVTPGGRFDPVKLYR